MYQRTCVPAAGYPPAEQCADHRNGDESGGREIRRSTSGTPQQISAGAAHDSEALRCQHRLGGPRPSHNATGNPRGAAAMRGPLGRGRPSGLCRRWSERARRRAGVAPRTAASERKVAGERATRRGGRSSASASVLWSSAVGEEGSGRARKMGQGAERRKEIGRAHV